MDLSFSDKRGNTFSSKPLKIKTNESTRPEATIPSQNLAVMPLKHSPLYGPKTDLSFF
jgi:hypothetical protein